MSVQPATWNRRITAQLLDLGLLAAVLVLVARILPEAPPPADLMAFFSLQVFSNYFTLVAVALMLTFVAFRSVQSTRATPGQKLLNLQLIALDGSVPQPEREQVNVRRSTTIRNMLRSAHHAARANHCSNYWRHSRSSFEHPIHDD